MKPVDSIGSFPGRWRPSLAALAGPLKVEVAGYSVDVGITQWQLKKGLLPLLAKLTERTQGVGRTLAGLAGIPGGGKSTLAAILQHLARQLLPPDFFRVLSIDGWHYRNAVLDARTFVDEQGRQTPLRERKGGPLSFDLGELLICLRRLTRGDEAVRVPVYDRRLHEPVPEAEIITPNTRVVLVEGNYVLGRIALQPQWDELAALLSPKVFLDTPPELARERIITRHIRGGCTPEQALRKYDLNDGPNTHAVLAAANVADFRVTQYGLPA